MEQIAIPKHLSDQVVSVIFKEAERHGVKAQIHETRTHEGVVGIIVIFMGKEESGDVNVCRVA